MYEQRRPMPVAARRADTAPPAAVVPAPQVPVAAAPPAPPVAPPRPVMPVLIPQLQAEPLVALPQPSLQPVAKARPRFRRRKSAMVAAAVAMVLIAGMVWWLRAGDQGSIAQVNAQQPPTPAYRTLSDQYMTFQYKGEYGVQTLPAQGNDLAVYLLRADTTYPKQLAVSVTAAPNGWQSDSAYLLRKSQPDTYSSQPVTVDGSNGVVWLKNDGTEETVMLPRGGDIVTLSFTVEAHGQDLTGGLDPEVRALLGTFRWQQ